MSDPSTDPVGTVRRDSDGGVWAKLRVLNQSLSTGADLSVKWVCIESPHPGDLGCYVRGAALTSVPVIGAVPGTPAAEPDAADDEAAVERIARALHRGAWERDIANGTPLEGNDVDACWSQVGAKYREWYYADARAALAALRGEQA